MERPGGAAGRVPVMSAAALVGMTFLAVGVLGFIPGVTSHYSQMTFAGHMSQAKLLNLFQVSVLHNVVHLLFGVAGLVLGRRNAAAARAYLIGGGVIYLVLWVYGLAFGGMSGANFVPLNTADNWLHLVLGIGMIGLGFGLSRTAPAGPGQPTGAAGGSASAPGSLALEDLDPETTRRSVTVEGHSAGTGMHLTQGGAQITGAHAGERVDAVDPGDAAAHPGYGDPAGPISTAPPQPADPTGEPRPGSAEQ